MAVTQKEIFAFNEKQQEYQKQLKATVQELIYEGTTPEQYEKMLINCESYEKNQGGSIANRMLIEAIHVIKAKHPTMFDKNHPLNK